MQASWKKRAIKKYRNRFALEFVARQFGERPMSVLSPVHAHEGAAPRRDDVNRDYFAVLAERVRQFFLSDEFAQVAHPQRRAANA